MDQQPTSPTESTSAPISVSASAAKQIAKIVEAENEPKMLRISVLGGGCSGFQYQFDLVETGTPGDLTIERDGVVVLVDEMSVPFLEGSELDYVEELIGASFQMRNPNATSSCGCGTSFAV